MSLLATIGTIASTINAYNGENQDEGLEGEFRKTFKNSELLKYNGNIVSLVNDTIVNPVLVVTKSATRSDKYSQATMMLVDMFTAYYLQAFQTLQNLYNNNTKQTIGILNKRSNGINFNTVNESYKQPDYIKDLITKESLISTEAIDKNRPFDIVKDFILKEIEVEFPVGRHMIKFKLLIKPRIIETTIGEIERYVAPSTRDKSFSERFMEWRSGGISFTDFVFATDLVKEYKNNKLKSDQDLASILKSPTMSVDIDLREVGSVLGGNGATRTSKINANYFAAKYNMFLFSVEDKAILDRIARGDTFKAKYKQDFLDTSNGIFMGTLDDEYEKFIVGVSDFYETTKIDYRQLEKRKDGAKTDFADFMKYLMSNSVPSTF